MKTSDLLTLAKPFLWDGGAQGMVRHICLAIDDAARSQAKRLRNPKKAALAAARMRALRHVTRCLGVETTVTDWLIANVPESRGASQDQIQAYRHRWLDHLIQHFKDKGD